MTDTTDEYPVRTPRDLEIEVIGAEYPDSYLYVGHGKELVLLCDYHTPKWRNGIGMTPANARKLAAALNASADNSERTDTDD